MEQHLTQCVEIPSAYAYIRTRNMDILLLNSATKSHTNESQAE